MSAINRPQSGIDDVQAGGGRTPEIGTIAQKYNEAFSKAVKAGGDGRA